MGGERERTGPGGGLGPCCGAFSASCCTKLRPWYIPAQPSSRASGTVRVAPVPWFLRANTRALGAIEARFALRFAGKRGAGWQTHAAMLCRTCCVAASPMHVTAQRPPPRPRRGVGIVQHQSLPTLSACAAATRHPYQPAPAHPLTALSSSPICHPVCLRSCPTGTECCPLGNQTTSGQCVASGTCRCQSPRECPRGQSCPFPDLANSEWVQGAVSS